MIEIHPVTLEGRFVRVVPLERSHAAGLTAIACDEDVWRYLSMALTCRADIDAYLDQAFATAATGAEIPLAIVEKSSGSLAGSTRIMDIRREHDAVEIGHTLLGKSWWRTVVNTETKYLLLRHLFETVRCRRVSLKTDLLNERSQRAIERLGAAREGVLRKHMIVQGGRVRDTVYYSIVDDEWPAVRAALEARLATP